MKSLLYVLVIVLLPFVAIAFVGWSLLCSAVDALLCEDNID